MAVIVSARRSRVSPLSVFHRRLVGEQPLDHRDHRRAGAERVDLDLYPTGGVPLAHRVGHRLDHEDVGGPTGVAEALSPSSAWRLRTRSTAWCASQYPCNASMNSRRATGPSVVGPCCRQEATMGAMSSAASSARRGWRRRRRRSTGRRWPATCRPRAVMSTTLSSSTPCSASSAVVASSSRRRVWTRVIR